MSSSRCTTGPVAVAAAEYAARWPRLDRCSARSRSSHPPIELDPLGQLSLLPLFTPLSSTTPEELERFHQQLLGHIWTSRRGSGATLELRLTNNRSTMISVRRGEGRYHLRLHRMFLAAGVSTLSALGRYVTDNDPRASAELGEFIDAHQGQLPPRAARAPRPQRIVEPGQHYHLGQLFERLNGRYFTAKIQARITWGRMARRSGRPRRHRSLKLGSYSVEDRLIRIHPTLDQPFVPSYFVEWIIYHEMLHQKHPIPIIDGRHRYHTPEFLAEERLFDEYERAHLWERRNLHRLLVF
jgi:predicted metal-dependent hydrolase